MWMNESSGSFSSLIITLERTDGACCCCWWWSWCCWCCSRCCCCCCWWCRWCMGWCCGSVPFTLAQFPPLPTRDFVSFSNLLSEPPPPLVSCRMVSKCATSESSSKSLISGRELGRSRSCQISVSSIRRQLLPSKSHGPVPGCPQYVPKSLSMEKVPSCLMFWGKRSGRGRLPRTEVSEVLITEVDNWSRSERDKLSSMLNRLISWCCFCILLILPSFMSGPSHRAWFWGGSKRPPYSPWSLIPPCPFGATVDWVRDPVPGRCIADWSSEPAVSPVSRPTPAPVSPNVKLSSRLPLRFSPPWSISLSWHVSGCERKRAWHTQSEREREETRLAQENRGGLQCGTKEAHSEEQ